MRSFHADRKPTPSSVNPAKQRMFRLDQSRNSPLKGHVALTVQHDAVGLDERDGSGVETVIMRGPYFKRQSKLKWSVCLHCRLGKFIACAERQERVPCISDTINFPRHSSRNVEHFRETQQCLILFICSWHRDFAFGPDKLRCVSVTGNAVYVAKSP